MFGNSPVVVSNQIAIHDHLTDLVTKHLETDFQKPYHPASLELFPQLTDWLDRDRALILDSGCGTGESSVLIATRFPTAQVLGIDQSSHRLNKTHAQSRLPDNLQLLHADVVDIWRWLVEQDFPVAQHFLLYPNPWPKSKHIQRRWHGSAALKSILQLGGEVTLRSNWQLYVQEFQAALSIAHIVSHIETLTLERIEEALTPFEAKYFASQHALWQLTSTLP